MTQDTKIFIGRTWREMSENECPQNLVLKMLSLCLFHKNVSLYKHFPGLLYIWKIPKWTKEF